MNRKELKKSYIIKMAVDGKITVEQASTALNFSYQTIRRICISEELKDCGKLYNQD